METTFDHASSRFIDKGSLTGDAVIKIVVFAAR
jgi:hypothetical protein